MLEVYCRENVYSNRPEEIRYRHTCATGGSKDSTKTVIKKTDGTANPPPVNDNLRLIAMQNDPELAGLLDFYSETEPSPEIRRVRRLRDKVIRECTIA